MNLLLGVELVADGGLQRRGAVTFEQTQQGDGDGAEIGAAFGGTLDAGVLPGGGFQVRAFLPVAEPVAPLAERVAPAAAQPVPDAAIGQPT